MREIQSGAFLHDLRGVLMNGVENPSPGAYAAAASCGFLDGPEVARCALGREWAEWCGLLCAGVAAAQRGELGKDAPRLPQIIAENQYRRQAWLIHQSMDNYGPHLFRQLGSVCKFVTREGNVINVPHLYNSLLRWDQEDVRGEWKRELSEQVQATIQQRRENS